MKFSDVFKKYIEFTSLEIKPETMERYGGDVMRLCLFLRNPDLKHVTDEQVISYLKMQLELGWKHNGIVTQSSTIRRFFEFAYDRGYTHISPKMLPVMRKEWVRPRIATEEDYKKVLNAIPDEKKYVHIRNRAIIMLLWDTGARNGEIASLDERDLDLVKMKSVIKTEKSRGMKPFREVYWTKHTNEVLKRWLAKKHELESRLYIENPEALFWGSTNNWQGKRLSNSGIDIALRKYSNLAKVPSLNPHSFRHHMGHDLSERGANNSQISSILGHSNLSSSFIYTELNNREREKTYNKFKRNGK